MRRGTIRTGDIYTLESWQNAIVRIEIAGSNLAPRFIEELRIQGIDPDPRRVHTIATIDYVADEASIGKVESRVPLDVLLRDATIDHVRRYGFDAT